MSELGITIWITSLLVFSTLGGCVAVYFDKKRKNK